MARLAKLVSILAAAFLAFALVWDQARDPYLGLDYYVYSAAPPPAQLAGSTWPVDQMQLWASQYDVDVVIFGSRSEPGVIVGYAAHPGSEFDRWVRNGYPCLRPCVAKPRSLASDPAAIGMVEQGVGQLAFMGPDSLAAATAAQQYFADIGWKMGVQDVMSYQVWRSRLFSLFPQALTLVVALIFMLMAAHVLTRGRAVGVQLLQGTPRWQIWLADSLHWSWRLFLPTVVVAGGAYLTSRLMWSAHLIAYMVRAGLLFLVVFWAAGISGTIVAHQILRATSILEAVKGRLRFGLSFPIVYGLRTLLIIMASTLLLNLGQSWSSLQGSAYLLSHLGAASDLSNYATTTGAADDRALRLKATTQLAPMFTEGLAIYTTSIPAFFYSHSSELAVRAGQDRQVMLVNQAYLSAFPVRFADGKTLDPVKDIDRSRPTILVPPGVSRDLENDAAGRFASMRQGDPDGYLPGWDAEKARPQRFSIEGGGQRFTYVAGRFDLVRDPIILVLPATYELGQNLAFDGGILIRKADISEVVRRAPELAKAVGEFDTIEQQVRESREAFSEEFAHRLMELVMLLLLLPLASAAIALMYARQHAQRIFVQAVNGRPQQEMIPLLIALDVISLCGVAWFARPQETSLEQLHVFGETATQAPLLIFLYAVLAFSSVLLLQYAIFAWIRRQIVLQRGAEA